jgi:hypothetical protein
MKRLVGLSLTMALALVVVLLPNAFAQTASGNIYGSVTDESGAVLPGVAVKLTSALGNRETTSDSQGNFRFLDLDHGSYTLTATLAGFTTVQRSVQVDVGQNTTAPFQLKVASMGETVTVTSETTMIDAKKLGTSTTMTDKELSTIPSGRDPWAMLRAVPGITMDRVNIGGNENGQQAGFTGKGDNGGNVMWNMDGVVITDMSSLSSPSYYDFDAFDEVSVGTGGNAVTAQTGGVNINLTTRRGTNAFHGSVHDFIESHKIESQNLDPSRVANAAAPGGSDTILGDHIQQLTDYGADLGGPIIKDKLWFYGSWGKQDIRLFYYNGTRNHTDLTAYNGKLNWQASPNDMISAFYFNSEKSVAGRSPGSGLNEPTSILWNQGNVYTGSLHGLIKAEWDHTFSPNFFMTGKYVHFDTGFGLIPENGLSQTYTFNYNDGNAYGDINQYSSARPSQSVNIDASAFSQAWGASHEFKFGFGWRKFNITSTSSYGGNGIAGYVGAGGPTGSYAIAFRNENASFQTEYWSGYASDTITKDRWTINLGLRYDHQTADNVASSAPANVALPDVLPTLNYTPSTPAISWNSISPRGGFTVALDDARKTLLRTNVAYYASQIPAGAASQTNAAGLSYVGYPWTPSSTGAAFPVTSELDLTNPLFTSNIDLANPTVASSPNLVASNYGPRRDLEVIVGLDRELAPALAVNASYTWRKATNIDGWTPLQNVTTADYVPIATAPNGNGLTGTYYDLNPNVPLPPGTILGNRPDYHTNYSGVELNVIKRLSSRWMGRLSFTYGKPTETIDGPGAIQNPTLTAGSFGGAAQAGPQINGGLVAPFAGGSGKGFIQVQSDWQFVANGLVQLGWDMELAGALFARQGTPLVNIFQEGTANGTLNVLTAQNPTLDNTRYPDVWDLDLHLSKAIHTGGSSSLLISADCFNVFNSNTTTSQNVFANSSAIGHISNDGTLNPRVFRLGLRFRF